MASSHSTNITATPASQPTSAVSRQTVPSSLRKRGSINSSFSFGPQHLVDSYRSSVASRSQSALDPNCSILQVSPLRSSPHRRLKRKDHVSRHPHPLANDTSDVFQDSEIDADQEDDDGWDIVDRMRLWRHDALMQHLYETAAFWGDKIMTWTNDPNDAFWLAQTYFSMHQYSRAERLLTRPFATATSKPPTTPPPQANGHIKGKGKDMDILQTLPFPVTRLPTGPGAMMEVPEGQQDGVSRLVDMSVACRYLAAQCQIRQGNWSAATELLGEANPFRDSGRSGPGIPNVDGGIKIEASMCNLRGLLMQKLGKSDQAKACFMEALALDVKCFDAFQQLLNSNMMTPDEEWEFVQGLAYATQTPQDASFVQMMYTTRVKKYRHAAEHALTRQRLVEDYGLGDNPDVLFSFADTLFVNYRWADCFAVTSRILGLVDVHSEALPLHIGCMFQIPSLHSRLFVLAHEMVEREPENFLSWYAVGLWYFATGPGETTRQYLSKTSLMDPRFAPAWIAFGHSFSKEKEHEHAIIAYSSCARMFPGSHIPLLYVGMEQLKLANNALAEEALNASYAMCPEDPLLFNEKGVLAYNCGEYKEATDFFERALKLAEATQSAEKPWASTYLNLGSCYRKLKRYEEALANYEMALNLDPRNHTALAFTGMVCHLLGDLDKAIVKYHESLSIEPLSAQVSELLNLALESSLSLPLKVSKEEFEKRTAPFNFPKNLLTSPVKETG